MNEHEQRKRLLSTSSPEGLHIAAEITSTRIAEFLIREGPQPMRRINSQLAIEVQGFDLLSLSKQRRLIMSAMEQTDPKNNCVFEKIGWGQWAVRKVDSDYIESKDTTTERRVSVQDLRSQGVKLGWSKKTKSATKPAVVKLTLAHGPLTHGPDRRESISNNRADLHGIRVPSGSAVSDSEDDFALSDDDDVEQGIESDSESEVELDEGVFQIDDAAKAHSFRPLSMRLPPPIKFAQRVPLKVSPPPGIQGQRRRSLNSSLVSKPRHSQYFSRSRLNSYDALDNYIGLSQKGSGTSLSPGPGVATPALLTLPWNRGNYIHQSGPVEGFPGGRRKSLFNELHIRLTLLQLLPKLNQKHHESQFRAGVVILLPEMQEGHDISNAVSEDTDEEDWATIGAELLRSKDKDRLKQESDEAQAAQALVNLMSV